MEKIKISNNAFIYPMPVVLVGTVVDGKAAFCPVSWVSRANSTPPMVSIALNSDHATAKAIEQNKVFSVNTPSEQMVRQTDYCGLVSARETDKSQIFSVFTGDLQNAPMIENCPLAVECTLYETLVLPSNILYIGQVTAAYTEGKYLTDGKVDIKKIKPFTLTMPDNNYWKTGQHLAKAWSIGKSLEK